MWVSVLPLFALTLLVKHTWEVKTTKRSSKSAAISFEILKGKVAAGSIRSVQGFAKGFRKVFFPRSSPRGPRLNSQETKSCRWRLKCGYSLLQSRMLVGILPIPTSLEVKTNSLKINYFINEFFLLNSRNVVCILAVLTGCYLKYHSKLFTNC